MADSVRAVIDRKQRFVAALFAFIKLLDFLSRSGKEVRMKKTDYTGKKVGWLTVLKELPKQKKNDVVWLCQCDCGKMINRTSAYLRTVGTASCGCYAAEHHKMQRKDITGKRFGKLVAVEPTGNMSERRQCIWRFRCDCGNIIERPAPEITKRNNPTRSCGCSKTGYIGNSEHGKQHYHNIEKNYVMGTNIERIRRGDASPMKNNTSGYQGVSFISTRNVWVAAMRFQGSLVSKTCHSLEDAIAARKQMREIRDEFVAWYDSLSEEEKKQAVIQYDNNRAFLKAFYRNKLMEIAQR